VRIGKPPKSGSGPGRFTSVVQVVPSWLAWSWPFGGVAPKKPTPAAIAIEKAWARKGCANSHWNQAGLPSDGIGSATVRPKRPSTRAAASMSPPLVVTWGCASMTRTSSSGRRYASTTVSA
jgi:hypothetical protein